MGKRGNRREEWRKKVTAYRTSNQTAQDWCQTNKESIFKLRYWVTQINKEKSTINSEPSTVFVQLTPPPAIQKEQQETVGIRMQIGSCQLDIINHCPAETIKNVLLALQSYDRN